MPPAVRFTFLRESGSGPPGLRSVGWLETRIPAKLPAMAELDMDAIKVGAQVVRPPATDYLGVLDAVEVECRMPLPGAKVLNRWREAMPAVRYLKDPGAERAEGAWLKEAVEALKPSAWVVVTGIEATPSPQGRQALKARFDTLRAAGVETILWHALGVWEFGTAADFARETGVSLAVDPLALDEESWAEAAASTASLYLRVVTLGRQAKIAFGAFDRLIARLEPLAATPIALTFLGAESATLAKNFKRFREEHA